MAALAIVAVAAVMLLSGSNPAQADTASLTSNSEGGNLLPQQTDPTPTPPRHASPEPCPGETGNTNTEAARVVDSGHIALFDVYWNPGEGELTNTVCPPTVVHVPEDPGDEEEERPATPARDDRSPSSIDITAEPPTIIHIPSSAKVNLNTDATYTATKYHKVKQADDLENRDGSGTGDGDVWALPACPPGGSPAADGLCISFSAALLKDADWDGDIVFHLDHVHQIDIDEQDPRYVIVHDVTAAGEVATDPLWNSSDASESEVSVEAGGYNRPIWFFTDRGTYEFQVHIQGKPDQTEASKRPDGLDPISKDASVTSDVRDYIVHVGAEANLGVEVAMAAVPSDSNDTTLDPTEDVTVTVTASSAGPDMVPHTKVNVRLPDGLTYSSHTTDTTDTIECPDPDGGPTSTQETYCPGTGVWAVGSLNVTDDQNTATDDDPPTLTITATVDADTRGRDLTVETTISATEPVEITKEVDGVNTAVTYDVPVPDPTPGDDMDTDTITVSISPNAEPMFQIMRSVPENSAAGTSVGDRVAVREPDTGDTLTFDLTGIGAGNFTATSVSGGAQISVADGAHLNYEHNQSYDLVLTVSDGKDTNGNSDSDSDHSIAVQISLEDVAETVTATVGATVSGGIVTWTFTVTNPPAEATNAYYRFGLRNTATEELTAGVQSRSSLVASLTHNDNFPYVSGAYRVEGSIQYDADGATHYVHADVSGDQIITIP